MPGDMNFLMPEFLSQCFEIIDQVPQMKRAKQDDGFYGFNLGGSFRVPRFTPMRGKKRGGGRGGRG